VAEGQEEMDGGGEAQQRRGPPVDVVPLRVLEEGDDGQRDQPGDEGGRVLRRDAT